MISEILKKTREKIADPAHWTTKHYARINKSDNVGTSCVLSPQVTCWCLAGAMAAVAFDGVVLDAEQSDAFKFLKKGLWNFDPKAFTVQYYNDTHTHTEVIAFLDKHIEKAEKEGV